MRMTRQLQSKLRQKYMYAKKAYKQNHTVSFTNQTEVKYTPQIIEYLKSTSQFGTIKSNGDNFENYLGIDLYTDKGTIDIKICHCCLNCTEDTVLIDCFRKLDGKWVNACELKINDYYLFDNGSNYYLVPRKDIEKIIDTGAYTLYNKTGFMEADKYKTTKKAFIVLDEKYKLRCP